MPPFGRVLLGLALCLSAAGGEGGAGGGGAAGGAQSGAGGSAGGSAGGAGGASGQTSGSATTTSQQPTFDAAKAQAEARAAALKALGFDDDAAFEKAKKAKEDEENARLTEAQKQKKLYDDAQEARGKAEAKAEREKARADAAEAREAMRDRLDNAGVTPSERKFAEVALRDAEAEEKKAGRAFDEAKFFEKLRTERPYFFSQAGAQNANTALRTTTTPANSGSNGSNGNIQFDASKLSPEDWRKWRLENT